MEFRFNINKIFKNNISRIGNSLLPVGFVAADRRTALDTTAYVAEVINTIGAASAIAQGLNQPVTTADRLRNTEGQVIYLMTEDDGKNGLAVGLLKVGRKSLYVFDKYGDTKHVNAPCVLDFYIHESRQRAGLGKVLYDHMLEYENLLPEQLAIDRPSEKLLLFLKKHYGLTQKIQQMNNFVLYDGFFAPQESQKDEGPTAQMHITASPNSSLFGPQFIIDDHPKRRMHSDVGDSMVQESHQVFGRYGAPKPHCSLNQIIHNKPVASVVMEPNRIIPSRDENIDSVADAEQNGTADAEENGTAKVDEPLVYELQLFEVKAVTPSPSVTPSEHDVDQVDSNGGSFEHELPNSHQHHQQPFYRKSKREIDNSNISHFKIGTNDKMEFEQTDDSEFGMVKINGNNSLIHHVDQETADSNDGRFEHELIHPNHHHHQQPFYRNTKRQTGKKNISNFEVGTNDKMEFEQTDDRDFGVVKINRPITHNSRSRTQEHLDDGASTCSRDSGRSHTAEGFFDLKFYSHPLW